MIEVGDYVRTTNKGIKKIDRINNNKTVNKYLYFTGIEDFEGKEYAYIKITEILKHSKNIIDLIEVGDFIKISYDNIGDSKHFIDNEFALNMIKEDLNKFKDKRIKEILTKEQYNSNCFRWEGNKC